MGRNFGMDLLIGIRTEQEQYHRAGITGSIDRKPGSVIIRQRCIDNNKIISVSQKLPTGCCNIVDNSYWVIVRAGEQRKQCVVEFLRR